MTTPRFQGEVPATLTEKRCRLLDFADFLNTLKPEKFDHGNWCEPDHTCKTTACGGGWATILYSKVGKEYITAMYAHQRAYKEYITAMYAHQRAYKEYTELQDKQFRCKTDGRAYKRYQPLIIKAEEVSEANPEPDEPSFFPEPDEPSFFITGQNVLGLSESASNALFCPGNTFWDKITAKRRNRAGRNRFAGSEEFALAIRYLAHRPNCEFEFVDNNGLMRDSDIFDSEVFKKYIEEHPITEDMLH